MSEENVKVVRAIYDRWASGDYSFADWADTRIEFCGVDKGVSVGTEAMARRWRDFLASWDEFITVPEKFLDAGEDRVLVLTRFGGTGKGSGTPIDDFPGASLFTLREGKVIRLFLYTDQKEGLEAAGLSE